MRSYLDPAIVNAIQNREALKPVNYLWIRAKNRSSGAVETLGLWSGWDTVTAQVLNPDTLLPTSRVYHAGGGVVELPTIPLETNLTVRTIRIVLSQVNTAVLDAIQGYDAKHAPVEIHRGPVSRQIPDAARRPAAAQEGRVRQPRRIGSLAF